MSPEVAAPETPSKETAPTVTPPAPSVTEVDVKKFLNAHKKPRKNKPLSDRAWDPLYADRYVKLVANKHRQHQRFLVAKRKREKMGFGGLAESVAYLDGGIKAFKPLLLASVHFDPSLKPLVDAFFGLGLAQQTAFKLEEMCRDFDVRVGHVLGVCAEAAFEHHMSVARMIGYLAMSEVVRTNITEAQKPEGFADRRLFMLSNGLLPVPEGSTINVNASSQSAAFTKEGAPTGFPSFEESTNAFSEIIRNAVEVPARALPEPIEVAPDED